MLIAACVPAGDAQTGTLTTVMASPSGPQFTVDGTTYFSPMSAFWPVGSLHTLSIPAGTGYSYDQTFTTQYQFQGWSSSSGLNSSTTIQVIANVGTTKYTAVYNTLYQFSVQFACNPAPCSGVPGTVQVNGGLASSTPVWQSLGTSETLLAASNPGYIFAGWAVGTAPLILSELTTVSVAAPTTVTAVYIASKPVSLVTNPPGLEIYADGTLVATPQALQWALGSSHTVSQLPKQNDSANKYWVPGSWSDGGATTHTYVVGKTLAPETLTATYAAAASAYFLTSPINLNLVIDNVVLPPPYGYIWGVGSSHTVSATTPQTDAQGSLWVFQSWDDGTTAPVRNLTVPVGADVNNNFRMTALYTQQAKLTVNSTVSGQVVTVNGSPCTTPCSSTFAVGAQVRLTAPASIPVSSTSRQDFVGWATGIGAPVPGDWVGSLSSATTSITATYRQMNQLSTSSTPAKGGTWRLTPASADGYYDSQAQVSVGVAPRPGYRFAGWGGDLSGSDPRASLNMNVPHSVTAQFSSTPIIGRGGVRNGAGVGVSEGVAQGSVASIYGENLTAETSVAPSNSTAKSLAGVTVHAGTRALPLYFASPEQINFQIPADLPLGSQSLTVSSPDAPDTTAEFSIVRNAPGLFPAVIEGHTYAMVTHEDGSAVTAAAPARQGELLSLYGTGFGPTDHVRPQGAAVPVSPAFRILDPVTIQIGSGRFSPESALAAPGQIGVDVVQFRLDSSVPSGAAIPLTITVNGVTSNSLSLPVQ
jgi:uncharacterized protein (TIGR03437 family)